MANQQIKRLFRRRPEIDETEIELLQALVLARLTGADRNGATTATEAESEQAVDAPDSPEDLERARDIARLKAREARLAEIRATTYELPENAVGVMAEPVGELELEATATESSVEEPLQPRRRARAAASPPPAGD